MKNKVGKEMRCQVLRQVRNQVSNQVWRKSGMLIWYERYV